MSAAVLGAYVRTPFGHKGRVIAIHDSCPGSEAWQAGQAHEASRDTSYRPWVSVLVNGGGSVTFPRDQVEPVEPFPFTNSWAAFYFGEQS